MKRTRRFALLPLALLVVGLVALQAGPALAVKILELEIAIDCPPATAQVGDTLTWVVTLTNTKSAVQEMQVTDEGTVASDTTDPTDEPDPFNQNDTYQTSFTYTVQATDVGTTINESAHVTAKEEGVTEALDSDTCSTVIGAAGTTPTTPRTGFSPLPYAAGAILLLMVGGWVSVESRRRRV